MSWQNNNQGMGLLLDKLLMLWINNANNISDVTVYFPDSGQFITCPAGATGYFPCLTQVMNCYVYNGYSGAPGLTNPALQTQIIFCNFALPVFLTQSQQALNAQSSGTDLYTVAGGSGVINVFTAGMYDLTNVEVYCTSALAAAAGSVEVQLSLIDLANPSVTPFSYTCVGMATAATSVLFTQQGRANWRRVPMRMET
jgi:hypothetical protein